MTAPGAALAAGLWPDGARRGADGALVIGGADVRALADDFGTPAYLLDEADLRGRARAFREAAQSAFAAIGTRAEVFYAGKAFLSVAVARWVTQEGLSIDVATGGELAVALRAGVPGERLGVHGNNKSDAELRRAVEAGAGRVVVDSLGEIDRLARIAADRPAGAAPVPVMVRVTTGVHAGGHEFIATAHEDQKFGLSIAAGAADEALRAVLARPGLALVGVHSHIGSQIADLAAFAEAARRLLALRAGLAAATGHLLSEVDLGGGYGIAYLPGERPLAPGDVAERLAAVVAEVCAELGTPVPRVSIEPGRAIVGPAGVTLYTVGVVKPVRLDDGSVRTYVAVDGGMSDNIRPALYDARYSAVLANRVGAAEGARCRVVGKHCESGDIVVHDVELPADVAPGDLLAVPATGAYGHSMASNYNHVPRPPVVAVRDGVGRVIVRRETEADLLALDVG